MGKGGTTIQAPAAPNYNESMKSILQAQVEMAPQVYASEAEYQPKYQQLQQKQQAAEAEAQIGLYKQLQPSYSQLEADYNKSTQEAQQKALEERAPNYIKAFQKATGIDKVYGFLQDYANSEIGQMQLGNAGPMYTMNPEETRAIDQQSKAGYAAQGTALGQQANLSNVLNRYNFQQQRKQQILANAANIGSAIQQANTPAMASFYQQPMYASSFGGQALGNAVASQGASGPALFNPESQTGMGSIYGAYNAQMGLAGAQAQANAAKSAGQSGMFGALGGGLLTGGGTVLASMAGGVAF